MIRTHREFGELRAESLLLIKWIAEGAVKGEVKTEFCFLPSILQRIGLRK